MPTSRADAAAIETDEPPLPCCGAPSRAVAAARRPPLSVLRSWRRYANLARGAVQRRRGAARQGRLAGRGAARRARRPGSSTRSRYGANPLVAFLLNVAALYLTMGFRQRSHFFTDIHCGAQERRHRQGARDALGVAPGELRRPRSRGRDAPGASRSALVSSHRYVFGVIFWFVLLPGPTGAILYRLSMFLDDRWSEGASPELERFSQFAHKAFAVIDWLPARFTAAAFAVVGDFEKCGRLLANAGCKLAGPRARHRAFERSRCDRSKAGHAGRRGRKTARPAAAGPGRPRRRRPHGQHWSAWSGARW